MSYIGKNIRKIRTVKKLSQAAFAELFDLARPSVGAYEEGRAEPKLDTVIQIANHFGISVDSLLTKELTINDLYNFNIHVEGGASGRHDDGKKAAMYSQMIKSVFVPAAKQVEYIVHINNRDFIAGLPKILIPNHHDKNHRAFEMTAGDMHDHFHGLNVGDMVLGRKMDSPFNFEDGKIYIIVTQEKIIIRRTKQEKNALILIPDNPAWKNMEIKTGAILEAWEVVGYYSDRVDAPARVPERLMVLEDQMEKLLKRLEKIEGKDKK